MEKNIKIKENLHLIIQKKSKRTIVSINIEGKKIVLSNLRTDEYFWSDVVYDENYIVVYSRGCMFNQIPMQIESAYNIKTNSILDIKNNKKLAKELEYMFISKYGFDVSTVISLISESDLKISDEEDIEHMIRYLTNGNNKISKEDVINYVLNIYPQLLKYKKLKPTISISEYKRIIKEIGNYNLYFHKMPQIIDSSIENQKFDVLAVPTHKPFIVKPEKVDELTNNKSNYEETENIENMSEEFKINNLVNKGPVLEK